MSNKTEKESITKTTIKTYKEEIYHKSKKTEYIGISSKNSKIYELSIITEKTKYSNSASKESQNIIASIIKGENVSDSAEESFLTNSVEFLKKEKVSMKKILDKVFIHVYSFYWRKISCNEDRLLAMNCAFEENFYEENENDGIILSEDNSMFEEYKQIIKEKIEKYEFLLSMPFSILKEKLTEFIENIKTNILKQDKNKTFIEKHNKLKTAINDSKKKSKSEEEWLRKCDNEFKIQIANLVNEYKNQISEILKDLEKVYKTILEASTIIEQIVIYPLSIMNDKHKQDISIEKIHKKSFLKIIQKDGFIKSLIVEVNSKDYNFFNDLKNLIRNYEEDITQTGVISDKDNSLDESCNENLYSDDSIEEYESNLFDFKDNVVKFNEFVKLTVKKESNSSKKCKNCTQKKRKFQNSSFEKLNNLKNELKNSSITNNISGNEKTKGLISTSAKEALAELSNLNTSKSNVNILINEKSNDFSNPQNNPEKNKVNNYNIDELCKYINGEEGEGNSKKKGGKKGKSNNAAKAAKQQKTAPAPSKTAAVNLTRNSTSKGKNNQNQNDNLQQICFETDKEIEEFRKKLMNNSIYANSVKKVKPNLSFEWIQSLPININN